jgi:hypothetical protein
MKKLLLLLTLTLTALPAFADLGDTYRTSCQRFGATGSVAYRYYVGWTIHFRNKTSGEPNENQILEQFSRNQCIYIQYACPPGHYIMSEGELYRLLAKNALTSQSWQRIGTDSDGRITYKTMDGKICALLSADQRILEVAYASWWVKNNRYGNGDEGNGDAGNDRPPVEQPI